MKSMKEYLDHACDEPEDPENAAWTVQQILEHAQQLAKSAKLSELAFMIGIAAVAAEESRTEARTAQPLGESPTHNAPRTIN